MSTVPGGIVQDLRLPGQEFDIETGLSHNGFRDYVPAWGAISKLTPMSFGRRTGLVSDNSGRPDGPGAAA
jgi:hypothetical protein